MSSPEKRDCRVIFSFSQIIIKPYATIITMQQLTQKLTIFTDGSSLGNPGPGGYGCVLVFPSLDEVIELGGMKPHTTNNEMELTAIVAAFSYSVHNTAPVAIYTDSSYAVNGITKWAKNWEKNGWMTKDKKPVSHKALWQQLLDLVRAREKDAPIAWNVVPGHMGIVGNERVDVIATEFAKGNNVDLFRGKLSDYNPKILEINIDEAALAERKVQRNHSNAKAYSYLSLVDGVLEKHATWAETETRVKGKKAKFRKATSAEHEVEIMKEWGV